MSNRILELISRYLLAFGTVEMLRVDNLELIDNVVTMNGEAGEEEGGNQGGKGGVRGREGRMGVKARGKRRVKGREGERGGGRMRGGE